MTNISSTCNAIVTWHIVRPAPSFQGKKVVVQCGEAATIVLLSENNEFNMRVRPDRIALGFRWNFRMFDNSILLFYSAESLD